MTAPRVPTLGDIYRDPVGSVVNIATAQFQVQAAAAASAINQTPRVFGADSLEGQAKTELQNKADAEARTAEETARADAVNNALSDKTLDATTREELLRLYQSGGDSATIADTLNKARQGKGIYGIRRLNQNQQEIAKLMPGRSQVLNLGTGGKIS